MELMQIDAEDIEMKVRPISSRLSSLCPPNYLAISDRCHPPKCLRGDAFLGPGHSIP